MLQIVDGTRVRFIVFRVVPLILAMLVQPLSNAEAVPALQLDIIGGTYDQVTESIIENASAATIVALGTPSGNYDEANLLSTTHFLSLAALKENGDAVSLSDLAGAMIDIDGVTFTDQDFRVGTPPPGSSGRTLGGHGVYDTAFTEFIFAFAVGSTTSTYNSEDAAGASTLYDGGTGSFFKTISVFISQLADGINLHFDLYTTKESNRGGGPELDIFAPFSHDAELRLTSSPQTEVPEPGSTIVFVLALLFISVSRMRSRWFVGKVARSNVVPRICTGGYPASESSMKPLAMPFSRLR